MWNDALDAKFFNKGGLFTKEKWDKILGNYSAISHIPAIAFAEDLLRCYPNAKVILVERDIEEWYDSFKKEDIMNVWNPTLRIIARLDTRFMGKLGSVSGRWTEGWMKARSRIEMHKNARPENQEHYALVERVTPPEQLLKFRLDQGWKPLCAFLGQPLPDVDFLCVNESAALRDEIGLIFWRGFKNALLSFSQIHHTYSRSCACMGCLRFTTVELSVSNERNMRHTCHRIQSRGYYQRGYHTLYRIF